MNQHRLAVLGLHRPGRDEALDPAGTPLRPGDVLLVQGPADRIEVLKSAAGALVLDAALPLLIMMWATLTYMLARTYGLL